MRDDDNRWQEGQQGSDYGRREGELGEDELGQGGQGMTDTDQVGSISGTTNEGGTGAGEGLQDESGYGTDSEQSERTGGATSDPEF